MEIALNVWGPFDPDVSLDLMFKKLSLVELTHLTWIDQIRILHDLVPFINSFATSIEDIGCVEGFEFDV